MDYREDLERVVKVAADAAAEVDRDGAFPAAAVAALRDSRLLGLTLPTSVGGLGCGPVEFVDTVTALARACGSTAMVYLMHSAAAMTAAAGPPTGTPTLLADMAAGRALGTLAFSERASRSHFWAPVSRATATDDVVRVQVEKSFVTSAACCEAYVVSTGTAGGAAGEVDLFVVAAGTPGVEVAAPWRGLGLRGNASSPMRFDVTLSEADRVGASAQGVPIMLQVVMPWFNLGNAAVSLGLADAALTAAVAHASGARLEHVGETLAELPTIRAQLARASISLRTHQAYLREAAASVAAPDEGTPLYVLSIKAAANDVALTVTDTAMRVCGGAAFSQQLGIERYFRDARAGHVMAPTADVLYDFYGKAITGQPVF
jgi:alkylation response protein AidB-like acyl-CoA dehydrogenase